MTIKKKKLAVRLWDAIEAFRRPSPESHKRAFQAGRVSRANADWTTERSTANYDLRRDLANVRARSRDAAHNHGHFRKFLGLTVANVIGNKGILLQPNARNADGSLNVDLNQRVSNAWKLWGNRETCTVSGKLDWLGVQRLVVTQLARDGEFLVQKVEAKNPFGFSLRVWDVNWLDETFEVMSVPGGNRIIMSIEVDDNDKPVAYWLTPPNEYGYTARRDRQRTRVPADQMIHGFIVSEDETQV
jgi:lambda family phage portal protein